MPTRQRRRKWPLWHSPRGVHGACCTSFGLQPNTKRLILVDPRDGRTSAAADRPDVRSVTGDAIAARRTSPSVPLLHLHVCARRMAERCPDQSSRRRTTWRELTSYFLLRPRGASLLAQTGRSEQGDVRSQSRWPRLDPPPPPFHRTHGLRRTTCGMAAASRGSHDRGRVKLSRTASKPA